MARPIKNKDYVICERIKESRIKAGLTQREMSEKLNIPLQTYKNWEQKRSIPNNSSLITIASICDADITWLMNINEKVEEKNIPSKMPQNYKIEIKKLSDYTTKELLAEIERRCSQ